jgi:hypothetical protein
MCRVHYPQATRAHRDVISDHDKWIGDVSSMQQTRDQMSDSCFSAIPIDGDRNSAHLAPKNADNAATSVGRLG